jgi:hypothetical protein
MSWTRTGTVSVTNNSSAVIGTGTGFLSSSRLGDAFLGPDGLLYEVVNIVSDTMMSISPDYRGVTSADAAYALIPVQGYPKALADSFNTLNSEFGATLAALGPSGTATGIKTALGLDSTNGVAEGNLNLYFTQARTLSTPLTGLTTATGTAVMPTDTLLTATGKLQAQVAATTATAVAALPTSGGTLSGPLNEAPTQAITSAGNVDIAAVTSNLISISGTTTITGLGTIAAGARRTARFLSSLVLTHNATSLILPTGANITTAVNDTAEFLSLGSGNWVCLRYNLASGKALTFSYDRANIVGAVSQTQGVPTGAVLEYVTNANGRAIKFADGSVIQFGEFNWPIQSVTTGVQVTVPHPVSLVGAFTFVPTAEVSIGSGSQQGVGALTINGLYYTKNPSYTLVQSYSYRESVATVVLCTFLIMGRWY